MFVLTGGMCSALAKILTGGDTRWAATISRQFKMTVDVRDFAHLMRTLESMRQSMCVM